MLWTLHNYKCWITRLTTPFALPHLKSIWNMWMSDDVISNCDVEMYFGSLLQNILPVLVLLGHVGQLLHRQNFLLILQSPWVEMVTVNLGFSADRKKTPFEWIVGHFTWYDFSLESWNMSITLSYRLLSQCCPEIISTH